MNIHLRSHPASIGSAALRHDDPVRILRVLNHATNWLHCCISVTKPRLHRTEIEFLFRGTKGTPVSVLPCLDGIVPEVFDCDQVLFDEGTISGILNNPRLAWDKAHSSLHLDLTTAVLPRPTEAARLVLINYRHNFVPPEFTSIDNVLYRIHSDTLLDCGDPTLGNRVVSLQLLAADDHTIKRLGANQRSLNGFQRDKTPFCRVTRRLKVLEVYLDLLLWIKPDAARHSRLQLYSDGNPITLLDDNIASELLDSARTPLDHQTSRYLGVALQLAAPRGLLNYDLDHSVLPDKAYRDFVTLVVCSLISVGSGTDIRHFHDSVRRYRDIQVANGLEERQRRIRRRKGVFVRDELFFQEPRCEKDLLALYFKLEGTGALPVESCLVLEHTPARGTDAIGHFRIDPADTLHQYALIEFEYLFANFLKHRHSPQHVDLIICWSVSENDPLGSTSQPWLMTYTANGLYKTLPVLVLSRIPELEIRHA